MGLYFWTLVPCVVRLRCGPGLMGLARLRLLVWPCAFGFEVWLYNLKNLPTPTLAFKNFKLEEHERASFGSDWFLRKCCGIKLVNLDSENLNL